MTETYSYAKPLSNSPYDEMRRYSQLLTEARGVKHYLLAVTGGPRKQSILEEIGMHHASAHFSTQHNDVSSPQFIQRVDKLRWDQMLLSGEAGEQWWNQMTGTSTHGLYYHPEYGDLSYTAGAVAAKLVFINEYIKNNGPTNLLKHNLVAVDWHISHGSKKKPTTVENKPRHAVGQLLERLELAQRTSESFFSSFAMAIRWPEGRMNVVETLVRCGILNPDLPFEEIARYVEQNKHTLPAGIDLYDAMQKKIIINDDPEDKHLLLRRWLWQGGAPPEFWHKYILLRRLDIAGREKHYVPKHNNLTTSEEYVRVSLGNLGEKAVKRIFFGDVEY